MILATLTHARVAMAFVAWHLTCVDATLEFLPADKSARVSFVSGQINLARLGWVLGRAAAVGALMLATGAESSAQLLAGGDTVAMHRHFGANTLDMSRTAATIHQDGLLARSTFSAMALFGTAVSAIENLLTNVAAHWNRVQAGCAQFAVQQ